MRRAYLNLHISIFLWGFTGLFGRAISLKEGVLVWYRLFITVVCLLILALIRRNIKKLPFNEIKKISFVGLLVALHWIMFYGAIKYSNISVGMSCLATIAVFTALLEPVITGRKFHTGELLLAVFSALGMYLIFRFEKIYTIGIILGLLASLLSSTFTILNKRLSEKYEAETLTFYELGTGLIYLTLLMPVYLYFFPASRLMPNTQDWGLLMLFSIACTVIPFSLSLKALKVLSAYTANLSLNLEPVYGICLAIIFFHEQKELHHGFFAGTLIILSSVIFFMIYKHRGSIRNFAIRN